MTGPMPRALICGMDNFAAKKLAKRLIAEEMEVTDISEGHFNYIFDFVGDKEIWQKAEEEKSKLTVICVDEEEKAEKLKKELREKEFNWRLVESYDVYGEGMGDKNFLFKAINQAVRNTNLVLPNKEKKHSVINVDDLVEAILRASFLSGTDKESFLVLGEKIDSEEVAKILIDGAKMTKYKVTEEDFNSRKEWNDEIILANWKKLKWKPEISFKEGIKATLQYFFSKIDEENRSKKKKIVPQKKWEAVSVIEPKKEKRKKELEVVVEPEKIESLTVEDVEEELIEEDSLNEPMVFEEEEKPLIEEVEKERKNIRHYWIFPAFFVLVLLLMPLNWLRITYFSAKNIWAVESLIKERKYEKAETVFQNSFQKVKKIDEKIDELGFNKISLVRNYQTVLKTIKEVLLLEEKSISLAKTSENINEAVFNKKEIDWKKNMSELKTGLSMTQEQIGILQARMKGNWSWIPGKWKNLPSKGLGQLEEMKKIVSLSSKMADILPEFLGLDGKRRHYLVILQNENELRPTGGFIGSYAILAFEKGKLLNFEINDVYEADGQLKGHVDPPEELRDYLGEAGWFMRDANWNPNFPQASKDLQWFLEKETGMKVDGVIGLNLEVIKTILEATGEIYIPDFNEKISKDNLYEQAEFYSENKFFPGSKQKASFLGGLGKQLFEEVKNLKMEKKAILYRGIINLLEEREIQVAMNESKSMEILGLLGWNGIMNQGRCTSERCFADYLYLVEANLGVNKANYFINRNIDQTIDITDESIDRVLKINYENTAKSSSWPGGDYKNYIRIYLPTDVGLTEINVSNDNDPNSKKVYSGEEIKIKDLNNKREIGFLVNVGINSKITVEIRYSSSINLKDKKEFSYLNYIQKQSGFGETNLVTLVSFPKDWQLFQVQPEASLIDGKLLFNQKLEKDIKMGVEIGR